MRFRAQYLRTLVSLVVAVAFAIAVTPGSMASVVPQSAKMESHAMAPSHCNHMKPQTPKEQGKPCKNLACLGMLGCFGMAAVATPTHVLSAPAPDEVSIASFALESGLTVPPDVPPPIS
jgi:hypothetical protein